MSFTEILVRDVEGERRIAADALPLRIGTGSDADLRLPGPGGGPVIMVDLLDGAPIVQPVGRTTDVTLDGEPLVSSRRLDNGNVLGYFGSRIAVATAGESVYLDVRLEDSAYVTQPPPADTATAADEAIAPVAFRRAAERAAASAVVRKSRLPQIAGAGLVVLLAFATLLFTSKSVEFDVTPADPDTVDVRGGWFRLPVGNRILLRRGEYSVTVAKAGYYDAVRNFVVADEPSMTVDVELQKRPGTLRVAATTEDRATVTVDGTRIGEAPFGPLELTPGEHRIQVRAERYLPYDDVVAIDGLERHQDLVVQLVPRWATVRITSQPEGATIVAGEAPVGTTPAVIELLEGKHDLSLVLDGHAAWDGDVSAVANTVIDLPSVRLQPANARLQVNSIPRGANVTVDGRYRGQSPIELDLAPGIDYRIGLSKAGYGVTSRQVRLQPAARDAITVDLTARVGSVTINVSPADASVLVDGRPRGNGTMTLQLSAEPHRIEVRRDGYRGWSESVTPRPGYPQTLTARLRSEESLRQEAAAELRKTAAGQDLRLVEPGSFSLGASRSEQGRRANEVIVPVSLSRPFLISVREITNREFAEFRSGHDSGAGIHPSMAGDNNPVASVSWEDAVQYCNWLSAREGLTPVYEENFGEWEAIRPFPDGYRLPTEAEWAWAMRYHGRAGRAAKFAWGDAWPPPKDSANLADQSANGLVPTVLPRYDDGFASTAPVGSFAASALGIFDVAGNVAEWVNDYYTVPVPGQTEAVADPLGPGRGDSYVIRGSSWRHAGITELRMSYRDYGSEPRPDVGFRIARYAD